MSPLIIHPSKGIQIDRYLPGDKSISHRALILAALANGRSILKNIGTGRDTVSTLRCLQGLGVDLKISDRDARIDGKGLRGLREPAGPLDCGNSGTTARLLAGVLAGQAFGSILTGDASLSRRPMRRIAEPLAEMGANMTVSAEGTLPMELNGGSLKGILYDLRVPSAQVKSCVLLAGLYADGETRVFETIPTRDHTERLMRLSRSEKNGKFGTTVRGGTELQPFDMNIPGDFSSAALLITAALMIPGSRVRLRNVVLNPTRTGFLEVLKSMGATVAVENFHSKAVEPFGDLVLETDETPLRGCALKGSVIPGIIDEIPALAVLGTRTDTGIEIRDAGELRHKECDRIAAIVYNLRNMGAHVEEYEDGFFVYPSKLTPAEIRSFDDHRIAMAFTAAAMALGGPSVLDDASSVAVSFPEFFEYIGITANEYELSA